MTNHILCLTLFLISLSPLGSHADLGPKPHFEFFLDSSIVADDKLELLTCEKANCEDQQIFREYGPQRFDCNSSHVAEKRSCYVMAYGFSPYLKLRLTRKGKSVESEPFTPGPDIDIFFKDDKLILERRLLTKLYCWWWCW